MVSQFPRICRLYWTSTWPGINKPEYNTEFWCRKWLKHAKELENAELEDASTRPDDVKQATTGKRLFVNFRNPCFDGITKTWVCLNCCGLGRHLPAISQSAIPLRTCTSRGC